MNKRKVTERDFRRPEFIEADPEDYEFRSSDNKLVRKDRFQVSMNRIALNILGFNDYDYECEDVVKAVELLYDQIPDHPELCQNCRDTGCSGCDQ